MSALFVPLQAGATPKRSTPKLSDHTLSWSTRPQQVAFTIPLTIHVATNGDQPSADDYLVRLWVQRANEQLSAFGISVEVRRVERLPPQWSEVVHWWQRRRLARFAPRDGTVHVFIVDALDRERTLRLQRRIRGLHWRYRGLNRGLRDREYVVVTRSAPLTTFAHEIGHLLGLRHHNSPDNIMCSCRRGSDLRFTPAQGEAMQAAAPRFSSQDHRRGGQAADRSRSKRRRR